MFYVNDKEFSTIKEVLDFFGLERYALKLIPDEGYECPDGTLIKVNNIKEAKELIKTYRELTIDQLLSNSLVQLTGFSRINKCPLCRGVGKSPEDGGTTVCSLCIWSVRSKPLKGYSCFDESFILIEKVSDDPIISEVYAKIVKNLLLERANTLEYLIGGKK